MGMEGSLVRDLLEALHFVPEQDTVVSLSKAVRHFILCLVPVQPRKTGNCPDMTEKIDINGLNK